MRRISLLLGVLVAAGCGSAHSSAPPRSTIDATLQSGTFAAAARPLHLALPTGWRNRSFSGGLGLDPHGLHVLVAANMPLPASIDECEALIPTLSRDQALVRIYDYGDSPLAPRAQRVSMVKIGAIAPVQQADGTAAGFSETRVIYERHTLVIDASFGSPHPNRAVRAQVAELLRDVGAGTIRRSRYAASVSFGSGRQSVTLELHEPEGVILLYRVTAPIGTRLEGFMQLPSVSAPLLIQAAPRESFFSCHTGKMEVTCTAHEESCPMPAGTWRMQLHKITGPPADVTIRFKIGRPTDTA